MPDPTETAPASAPIDTRNVIAKLAGSRAFLFACLMLVIVAVLVALGKAPYSELVTLTKWLGAVFVGGKSLEGAAELMAKR